MQLSMEGDLTLGSGIQTIITYRSAMSKPPSVLLFLYVNRLGLLIFCSLVEKRGGSCFFGVCADKVVGGTDLVPSFFLSNCITVPISKHLLFH